MKDELISATEMEQILGVDRFGIYRRVRRGTIPKPLKIGQSMFWRRCDWAAWLDAQAQGQGVAVVNGADLEQESMPARRKRGRPRKNEQEKGEKMG